MLIIKPNVVFSNSSKTMLKIPTLQAHWNMLFHSLLHYTMLHCTILYSFDLFRKIVHQSQIPDFNIANCNVSCECVCNPFRTLYLVCTVYAAVASRQLLGITLSYLVFYYFVCVYVYLCLCVFVCGSRARYNVQNIFQKMYFQYIYSIIQHTFFIADPLASNLGKGRHITLFRV